MEKFEHSKMPWTGSKKASVFQIDSANGKMVAICSRQVDAILILKAAKFHDRLVAALRNATELATLAVGAEAAAEWANLLSEIETPTPETAATADAQITPEGRTAAE